MSGEELAAWLRLLLTPGVGNESARKLLATFGLPEDVFRQSPPALRAVVGPKPALALLDAIPLVDRDHHREPADEDRGHAAACDCAVRAGHRH